eukprot:6213371-Pleurochrysis_carterae.AAC.2
MVPSPKQRVQPRRRACALDFLISSKSALKSHGIPALYSPDKFPSNCCVYSCVAPTRHAAEPSQVLHDQLHRAQRRVRPVVGHRRLCLQVASKWSTNKAYTQVGAQIASTNSRAQTRSLSRGAQLMGTTKSGTKARANCGEITSDLRPHHARRAARGRAFDVIS